jgi:hypothetical protein
MVKQLPTGLELPTPVPLYRAIIKNQRVATMKLKLNRAEMAQLQMTAQSKLNQILADSIEEKKEYGGMICKKGRLFVALPHRTQGNPTTVDVGQREPNCGCPPDTVPIAYYHTHPTYSVAGMKANYNVLSDEDKDVSKDYGIFAFVGTLDGSFLKYDPDLDKAETLPFKLNNSKK